MNRLGRVLTREEASAVEKKFAHHRVRVSDRADLAPHADAHTIDAIVRAAFWASLHREEGRTPTLSLAYMRPDSSREGLRFARPLPLTPGVLTRLGPAVEKAGVHVAVWSEDHEHFYVWGIVRNLPDLCFVLEVFEPGLLVIKYSRNEALGKFGNVAVLEGEQIKLVDESFTDRPDCPVVLSSLIGFDPAQPWHSETNLHVRLAGSIRSLGHGGLLLIVPAGDERWRDSIAWPAPYVAMPALTRLAELTRETDVAGRDPGREIELGRVIDSVAGLTAVDGATVMNRRHEVLAFGAMIRRSDESPPVVRLLLSEPVVGNVPSVVDLAAVGNSRHMAAAQFVHDQRDALALVASQDGRFTVFAWSDVDEMVHAYRIDALLL